MKQSVISILNNYIQNSTNSQFQDMDAILSAILVFVQCYLNDIGFIIFVDLENVDSDPEIMIPLHT